MSDLETMRRAVAFAILDAEQANRPIQRDALVAVLALLAEGSGRQALAWAEGYTAGYSDAGAQMHCSHRPPFTNPYLPAR